MTQTRRIISSVAVFAALLAVCAGTLAAQQAPACPTSERTRTVTYNPTGRTVQVTLPDNGVLCPKQTTGGCCDSIVITGLAEGWTVTGDLKLYYLFTTKYPPGSPLARQLLGTINVNVTVGASGTVEINNICYPPAHDWPSAEVHVDLALLVANAGVPVEGIGSDITIPGVIGPGLGGWDPLCNSLGCTPGYWKTHPLAWVGVSPTDLFASVFGAGPAGLTMLEATNTGGGGENGMIRHCSAAYVGAMWALNQPQLGNGVCEYWKLGTATPLQVLTAVQLAYKGTISFGAAQSTCAAFNENALCGPNGPWLNTVTGAYGGAACIQGYSGPATPTKGKDE